MANRSVGTLRNTPGPIRDITVRRPGGLDVDRAVAAKYQAFRAAQPAGPRTPTGAELGKPYPNFGNAFGW